MRTLKAAPDKPENKIRFGLTQRFVQKSRRKSPHPPNKRLGNIFLIISYALYLKKLTHVQPNRGVTNFVTFLLVAAKRRELRQSRPQVIIAWISLGMRDNWLYSLLRAFLSFRIEHQGGILSRLSCENCFSSLTLKCSYKHCQLGLHKHKAVYHLHNDKHNAVFFR